MHPNWLSGGAGSVAVNGSVTPTCCPATSQRTK
jgi:hypothetical protein